MWPVLSKILARYNVYLCIPFGVLGYYIEGLISNRYTPPTAPVMEQREERILNNIDSKPDTKKHFPLEVNLPPSLSV
ncbi:hypothetical protein ANTQUA_LOCUS8302 [Anthophora quadrimaculata]